ncbi:TetR/AcrR family transcriptional regulator [Georgenia sp. SYP-B2076]|uniref:TetR/AcrR family transcriptional regulator n=1 Tax=Georgenia sp. SYP-B2076 TaxID=2495881 RepID=UPI000F8F6CA4|nr:TetR/AcrR family transcriptional regulator [Georgenia sp. SYP-B2076]
MTQAQTPTADAAAPARRGPGRPRRADTEERCYLAVLELFGQKGWSGLSLDAVAHHAGIGKSAVYLRWKDKRALLLDAIRDMESRHVNPTQEGLDLREYLIAYTRARAELYLGEHGAAMANIFSAAFSNPVDFTEIRGEIIDSGVLALSGRIDQAIIDGELPPGTSPNLLLNAIEGGVLFHVILAPPTTHGELRAELEQYVTDLVEMVLRGLSA